MVENKQPSYFVIYLW